MTFTPPTETNPPYTTPPTWTFPTTAERWETDYRLRLLEAAVIWMWSNGSIGVNAGGDLKGTYPNPQVSMGVPPPSTDGGFHYFTDSQGEYWVAKAGVYSGNWKRARDVYSGRVYRNAAWTTATSPGALVPFDTVSSDLYGVWVTASSWFYLLVPGVYLITAIEGCTGTASGQTLQTDIYQNGSSVATVNILTSAAQSIHVPISTIIRATGNDQISLQSQSSVALAGLTGNNNSLLTFTYLGTG